MGGREVSRPTLSEAHIVCASLSPSYAQSLCDYRLHGVLNHLASPMPVSVVVLVSPMDFPLNHNQSFPTATSLHKVFTSVTIVFPELSPLARNPMR